MRGEQLKGNTLLDDRMFKDSDWFNQISLTTSMSCVTHGLRT